MATTFKYTSNYKRNLINYWNQLIPGWTIPKGFHVHHIKPKSTFKNKDDLKIHHPSNLIALHPDDHIAIHKNRGDKISVNFIKVIGGSNHITDEYRLKLSKAKKGKPKSNQHIKNAANALRGRKLSNEHIKNMSKGLKGRNIWNKGMSLTEEHKQKISETKRGRVAHNKGENGRKHYNNGLIGIMVFPCEEPHGFAHGRLCKKEISNGNI